jgi:hypothetical protein
MSQPQGHSVAGRIMSIKSSSDTIGNRTRGLPACSTVSQTNCATASPVSVAIVIQNLQCMHHIISSYMPSMTVPYFILHDFRKKCYLTLSLCFILSINLSEIFLNLKKFHEILPQRYVGLHVKYQLCLSV